MTTLEAVVACVVFVYGKVWGFDEVSENCILLDGACQGPQMDVKKRKFSFDHHANCIRMLTYSTCEQVWHALFQGLIVDAETKLYANDLDADTVLSIWLLLHPTRINESRVRELVERVGKTDSHGPTYPRHWMHNLLQLPYGSKEPQSLEVLARLLDVMSAYADGTLEEPVSKPQISVGWNWTQEHGWRPFTGVADAQCYLVQIVYWQRPSDTFGYLIRKKSDLVPVNLGPAHKVGRRPAKSILDYREDTLLGQLALLELARNPAQSHNSNWGGATCVGGEARNQNESGSCLKPEEVLALAMQFATTYKRIV